MLNSLPAWALVGLIVGHVYLFRRHGVTVPQERRDDRPDGNFWPDQLLRDSVASLAVMAAVLALVVWTGGAHLGAPADPTEPYSAARPDWYFLFLFQWLKYFPAGWGRAGGRAGVVAHGHPPGGGLALLRSDPLTQGPEIFAARCASCHRFNGHDGLGRIPADEPAASDLAGYGSRDWLRGLLDADRVATDEYFGATDHVRGRMARFVQRGLSGLTDEEREELLSKVIMAVSAEAELPAQAEEDTADAADIAEGRRLIHEEPIDCTRCHLFRGVGEDDDAPVLTGWASREWMMGMVHDPTDERYYGANNDRMPSFGPEGVLREEEIGLVVDWLRGDWYEAPESGSPQP